MRTIFIFLTSNWSLIQPFLIILVWCRYGGWDGKKWLSDVYVLDTSNFWHSCHNFFKLSLKSRRMIPKWLHFDISFLFEQFHLSGWSCQFQGQYLHQDVAILLLWLRSVCSSMVVEVILDPSLLLRLEQLASLFTNLFLIEIGL